MAISKTILFDKKLQISASLFKVLSHPARLAILKFLAETKTCITGDFSVELPLGRTTVGQHLTELKEAELITAHSEGVKTYYCLNHEKLRELKIVAESFISQIIVENDLCCK
jgi:ArsR family transcriptional regulator, arsenate/arsenite/antimonite-responsive transcriptional repressor